jgi:glycine/D-amino acid oxidase-like deaminating enzyme/nitrite reductase/ring-hydroxylating ferredoxin subunit
MNGKLNHTSSIWENTAHGPLFPVLDRDIVVDVAIVGAGITGVTLALLLKQAGKTVALLESARVASGVTGRSSAHLTSVLDERYQTLIRDFGEEGAHLAARSTREAISQIVRLAVENNVECDFERVPGYLYTEFERDRDMLAKELDVARRLGLDVQVTNEVPLPFPTVMGLRFADQAQFHPRKYVLGLAPLVSGAGSYVFEHTRVESYQDGDRCILKTPRGQVKAEAMVLATHSPVGSLALQTRIAPYRSYLLGARIAGDLGPRGLFWDTTDPYHYIRVYKDALGEVLLVGGADHKTGQGDAAQSFFEMEEYARSRFLVDTFLYRWSAQVYESADGLPYIGRLPWSKSIYTGTGYSGTGLTFGTLAASILADTLLGRKNAYASLYDPIRIKPIAGGRSVLSENLNVAGELLTGLFRKDSKEVQDVPRGEGRIIAHEGGKLAVYRDEEGELTALNPHCTHAGCVVKWNNTEKSWDCPCHGGRYTAKGEVIEGPPPRALEPRTFEMPAPKRPQSRKNFSA